jgi:hypothetical protein
MDNSPYLELSRKIVKKTGIISLAVTQVPHSNDFVLEFPYHHPQNSDKLEFLGLDLGRFNSTFNQMCKEIFAQYLVAEKGPFKVKDWYKIEGRNEWLINEGQKDTAWFDLKLWIDNSNIGKLYLYVKENSQSKFQEIFEIGTDIYEPLGKALSNLTPKNSAVRCGVYVRVFMAKDSGKLIAVDMALPYASDAAKIGAMFAENNL